MKLEVILIDVSASTLGLIAAGNIRLYRPVLGGALIKFSPIAQLFANQARRSLKMIVPIAWGENGDCNRGLIYQYIASLFVMGMINVCLVRTGY
ncbi:MAG: hypothetical protein GX142_09075 [Chloroflexi bacterium]|nr:hypothetical protein [Chloroflexota bacterium]